jgi:hypothetical protein
MTIVMLYMIPLVFKAVEALMVSRPQELPPQPLAERYVNLSIHTAPIRQTLLSSLFANGRTNEGFALQFLPEIGSL